MTSELRTRSSAAYSAPLRARLELPSKRRLEGGHVAIDTSLGSFLTILPATLLAAAGWVYWLVRPAPSRILPPPRCRLVPWQGVQVLAVAFAVMLFWPTLADGALRASPFLSWVYGPEFNNALELKDSVAGARLSIWGAVVSFPLSLATILATVKLADGHLYQVGLTGRHSARSAPGVRELPGRDAANPGRQWHHRVAVGAWVAIPSPHPLEKIGEARPPAFDWALIFVSAVVTAPIIEELLFRGLLQSWLASRPAEAPSRSSSALVLSVLAIWERLSRPIADTRELLIVLAPMLFVVVMAPAYVGLRQIRRSAALEGIFGSALLFGVAHSAAWPTPISLVLLGLALGLLYRRTQSVLPGMVMHALFNAVSFGELLFTVLKPHKGQ